MSKLHSGQKVTVNIKDEEQARENSLHMIDKDQALVGEVVYVHESGNVNVVVFDHSGSSIALQDVPTSKPKSGDGIYVTASK